MNRWFFVVVLWLTLSPAGSLCAGMRPNILFIYLDDFGWKDAGFMGSDFFETPHLDRLAAGGMVFTDAYACAANCAPSRACLLSGQYTPRHEIYNVGTGSRGKAAYRKLLHVPGVDTLDPDITTWAKRFQQAGYETATIGKWHLSDDPLPYGFDINIGGTHSGSPPRGYYPPHPRVPGLSDAPADEYLTDRLTNEAVGFIQAERDKPWLLYLTHFAVHTPLDAKRELVDKYKHKPPGQLQRHIAMATMIEAVDSGVGEIIEALQQTGQEGRTIILFSSDNGGLSSATDMAPLRGYKGTYYEGGIRVPLFVNWPGVVPAGSVSQTPVSGVDIYPTLCDMVGIELPSNQIFDGRSLVPLLKQTGEWSDRDLFWHFPAYLQAAGRSKLFESSDPLFRTRPVGVIRSGDFKLHQYFETDRFELYDLRNDPGEMKNLASRLPEKLADLKRRLRRWQTDVNAPIPDQPNPNYDPAAERSAIQAIGQR